MVKNPGYSVYDKQTNLNSYAIYLNSYVIYLILPVENDDTGKVCCILSNDVSWLPLIPFAKTVDNFVDLFIVKGSWYWWSVY